MNWVTSDTSPVPRGVTGLYREWGLAKILRNVSKFWSEVRLGSFSTERTVGTFFKAWARASSAWGSVARYLTTSHASAWWGVSRGIPMMDPPIWPAPYSWGSPSATGNRAVA